MSRLNRNSLRKMILKEFKMLDMLPMGGEMLGHSPFGTDQHADNDSYETPHDDIDHDHSPPASPHESFISKEDCCKAVLSLIECCDCPKTKQLIKECCEDILSKC